MDENSNQSSRGSQLQDDPEESKHRETESPMNLEYDSDTELREGDTLRMDDTDEEQVEPASSTVQETAEEKKESPPRNRRSKLIDSDSEDDAPKPSEEENKSPTASKKPSRIIDSDSEEETAKSADKTLTRRNLIDSDSGSDSDRARLAKQNREIEAIGEEIDRNMSRLKSLVDSDSSSPADQATEEVDDKKRKKKLKTKKERSKGKEKKKSPKDLLASLNLDFSDDSRSKASSSSSGGSGSDSESGGASGSGSDSGAAENRGSSKKNRKSSKKGGSFDEKPQRMSAKVAAEQMKLIQSESQRMAREASVSVPYHKPKQRTLEEFLNRKTVQNPLLFPVDGRKSLAAAIRMPPEQLEAFAKYLEEREKETIEFFKNENVEEADGKEEEPKESIETPRDDPVDVPKDVPVETTKDVPIEEQPMEVPTLDTEPIESLRVTDTEPDELDALVNKTCENAEALLASQATSPQPSTSGVTIDYNLFSQPTPPSKLAQKKAELLASAAIPAVPKLTGTPDMLIDLDSGELKPKTPSGPDILFKRFAKCSGKKAKPAADSPSVNILSTENGTIELDTVALVRQELEDRDPNGKDPIPGAAFAKLQASLREKMARIRMEALKKRLEQEQEEGGKKLEESDEEELEVDEEVVDDEDEEGEDATKNDLVDGEADEVDEEAAEDVAEDHEQEDSSEDSSDEDKEEEPEVQGEKKKSRIIAAFEDSDEEGKQQEDKEEDAATLKKAGTEELFSTLESEKFTLSDRNNLETGDSMSLLWKETEDPAAVVGANTQADLLELCSGRFGDTQAVTTTEAPLFSQTGPTQLGDSQLMALCSGTFATQAPPPEVDPVEEEPNSEIVGKGKLVIESSDEEDAKEKDNTKKKIKRKKRRNLNISDDEESESEVEPEEVEEPVDPELDEEEPERYVDYDSEENEVEVVLTKKDKQKVANTFLENEAELSESEWGSADEDEKDLDRYDIELGDEEKFDQDQLQQDLGRIHMRRVLEQDKKEVKVLQDMFFEDEEKDGVGRERQFRWKNVETTFSLDYDKKPDDPTEDGADPADEETEAEWRKMRHEREMLLKEKKIDLDEVHLTDTTLLDKTLEEEENDSGVTNTTATAAMTTTMVGHAKKRITVVRAKKSAEVTTPKDSPFLISRSSFVQGNKASFLARDEGTLNKLASLVKVNPEVDGTSTVVASKARNFVFATVSPAPEKMGSKRSLDATETVDDQSAKKAKTTDPNAGNKTKKRLLLGLL